MLDEHSASLLSIPQPYFVSVIANL